MLNTNGCDSQGKPGGTSVSAARVLTLWAEALSDDRLAQVGPDQVLGDGGAVEVGDSIQNGGIAVIEVRYGLPFRLLRERRCGEIPQ